MTGSTRLRVAVIGCGIGGPATALFLARTGHEVTIFDQADELGPKGAGILIAPTGQFVLDRLGLLEPAIERGSRIQRLAGHTVSGRKVMDIRYRHLSAGIFGLGIHRGSLFSILREALDDRKIEIKTGWQVTKAANGRVTNQKGESDGPFDLIVIADGARSTLRSALNLETKADPYAYGAIWVSATNWGDFPDNVLRQTYRGTKQMMGLLPSGRTDGGDGRQISLFWSLALRDLPLWRSNGLDHWKEEAAALMPGVEPLLAQIESEDQVTVASYFDVRTWSPVKDHCVLIGDAAHASSPQLGQGASLALFDAMTLAFCIEYEPNVMAALLQYRDLRQKQNRYYQLVSKWMTPFFQSGQSYLALPRDILLGPACRWPWLQKEMVATMSGLKESTFQRIPQEEQINLMGAKLAFGSLVADPSGTPKRSGLSAKGSTNLGETTLARIDSNDPTL